MAKLTMPFYLRPWLSINEAACYMHTSPDAIREYINNNQLDAFDQPSRSNRERELHKWRVPREQLDSLPRRCWVKAVQV